MKRIRGISLVEVLVTMAVMGTGLLAVASFQSGLLTNSGTNKARTEALAFAQARIEQFRTFKIDDTDLVTDRAEFDALFVDTNNNYVDDTFPDGQGGTTTTYHGNNADFTRKYKMTGGNDEEKAIEVLVEWSDRKGEAQSVALNTEIDWESPRSAGDLALESRGPLIPSATGRAHLGEGTLPPGAGTTPNGDGTALYDDGSGDLKLVVGNDIVLTLENACQSNGGSCIGFVKIKGRVFIDVARTSKIPGEVYVVASDAAYCHRYYMNGGTAVNVTSATTSALLTGSNGDYKYYDYTCYLGGGWHGNVGILLAGGIAQTDKVCMGDPTSGDDWAKPVIAARRAYRGMLYKHDPSNSPDFKEQYTTTDADGNTSVLTRYYSVGIGDSVELPDPDDSSQKPHDFVLSSLAVADTEGSKCIEVSPGTPGPMMRADTDVDADGTNGDMFAGMPTDWVCLNNATNSYIDSFDSGVYGAESGCAYDPTDLPSERHTISGTVTVTGDSVLLSNLALAEVVTSDGPGNCGALSFAYSAGAYTASYSCDIYEWGNGWNGYVEFKPNTDLVGCAYPRTSLSNIDTDTSNIDVSCEGGNFVYVAGSLDLPNGTVSLGIQISSNPTARPCLIDGATSTYKCTSDIFTTDWTGSVTYTSNKVICDSSGGGMHGLSLTINYANLQPQTVTKNLVLKANSSQCP